MIHQPLHPGDIVRELCVIEPDLTVTAAAKKLDVDRITFSRLVNGHSGISAEMAIRLATALDTSPILWMNLQRDYMLWKAEQLHPQMNVDRIEKAAE